MEAEKQYIESAFGREGEGAEEMTEWRIETVQS